MRVTSAIKSSAVIQSASYTATNRPMKIPTIPVSCQFHRKGARERNVIRRGFGVCSSLWFSIFQKLTWSFLIHLNWHWQYLNWHWQYWPTGWLSFEFQNQMFIKCWLYRSIFVCEYIHTFSYLMSYESRSQYVEISCNGNVIEMVEIGR